MKALLGTGVLAGGLLMAGSIIYISFKVNVALGIFTLGVFLFIGSIGLIRLRED